MGEFAVQYIVTFALLAVVLVVVVYAYAFLLRRPISIRMARPLVLFGLTLVLLIIAAGTVLWQRDSASGNVRRFVQMQLGTESNLLQGSITVVNALTATVAVSPPATSTLPLAKGSEITIEPQTYLSGNVIPVQAGQDLRFSLYAHATSGRYQVRLLWYDTALTLLSWSDSPVWDSQPSNNATTDRAAAFRTAVYSVPQGASRVRMQVRNTSAVQVVVDSLTLSAVGAYVEQHPNGALASVGFSFDWETAMGGPVHSRGMIAHDVAGATQHGLQMRQGADWLKALFDEFHVKATFYATGYNFLDGNTGRQAFSGDPVYKWASPKNGWASDYWLTHKWYSDDPYGTVQSDPAWYFGDQTTALVAAGHEIGSHTFAHVYVRGSNPAELATDLDEWLAASRSKNVPPPSTFAFPWRSSNSLTPDFYDVLYARGIRAVTRLYDRDLRDLYTVSAVPTYTQMLVMPDFRLEAPTTNVVEEATGEIIGLEKGKHILDELVARRGTTSFWTHPEQLAPGTEYDKVRAAWRGVVSDAAARRDAGQLWIGTIAEISAYQRDIMSATTTLEPGFLGSDDWTLRVYNGSGRDLHGLTLTLPAQASNAQSQDTQVLTAYTAERGVVKVSKAGEPHYPAQRIILPVAKPGTTTVMLKWSAGQEPPK